MNLSDMIIKAPEGGTFDLTRRELPTFGYYVGGAAAPLIIQGEVTPAVARTIESFALEAPAAFVGWWTDSETGLLYVDATDWYASHDVAYRQSEARREIAFWDISAQQEVRVRR